MNNVRKLLGKDILKNIFIQNWKYFQVKIINIVKLKNLYISLIVQNYPAIVNKPVKI